MKKLVLAITLMNLGLVSGQEVDLKRVLEDAIRNNLEIRASSIEVRSAELEYKAAKYSYLPRVKIEEVYTRTDLPAYAFMSKLNQERITPLDFNPSKLNNPAAINNFETKLSIEVPIWLGGKLQAYERASKENLKSVKSDLNRKKEEIIQQAYKAYADAVLAKESISVSKQALQDAKEHVSLAESMQRAGMALLSDVLRAKVYLSKAQEMLTQSENNYKVAKKAIELIANNTYGEFDVSPLGMCPSVDFETLRTQAVKNRDDIKSLSFKISAMRELSKATLSENLPQVYAFGSYSFNSKSFPLGADGKGYTIGLGISWTFDTGFSTYNTYLAQQEKIRAMQERLNLLINSVDLELKKAYAEYQNAMQAMESAKSRIEQSKEVLRIMKERYKVGLARIVDVLDAQTELDKARLEYVRALSDCHKAYISLLYGAGNTMEVLK